MPPTNPVRATDAEAARQPTPDTPATLEERVREGADTFDFSALLRRTNGGDVADERAAHRDRHARTGLRIPAWSIAAVVLALVVFVGPLWLYLAGDPGAATPKPKPPPPIAGLAGMTPAAPAAAAAKPAVTPDDEVVPQTEVAVPEDPPLLPETDPRYLFEPTDSQTLTSVMSRMPSRLKAQWKANGGNARNTVFARGGDTHLDLAYYSSGGTVRRIWQTWPKREWADSWHILGHVPGARSIKMVLLRKTRGLEVRVRDRRGRTWRSREINPNTAKCHWSEFKPD